MENTTTELTPELEREIRYWIVGPISVRLDIEIDMYSRHVPALLSEIDRLRRELDEIRHDCCYR